MEYAEKFDKKIIIKSIIFFIVLQLVLNFSGYFFKIIDNEFLIKNANFIVYFSMFILFIIVYGKTFVKSIKKVNKNNFKYLGIFLFLTLFLMITTAIIIDKIGIVNTNDKVEIASNYVLLFTTVVIFAPIIEEFTYRFFVFRSLEKVNIFLAHILTAFIFGFVHVWDFVLLNGDYTQLVSMLVYCVISLGASGLYNKTKNICYPILLHSIINLISIT